MFVIDNRTGILMSVGFIWGGGLGVCGVGVEESAGARGPEVY